MRMNKNDEETNRDKILVKMKFHKDLYVVKNICDNSFRNFSIIDKSI